MYSSLQKKKKAAYTLRVLEFCHVNGRLLHPIKHSVSLLVLPSLFGLTLGFLHWDLIESPGMNSLTYLSRQFDVLASAHPSTPPSALTAEKAPLLETTSTDKHGGNEPMRSQTWSKPLTEAQIRPSDPRPAKRALSLPAFVASSTPKMSAQTPYAQNAPSLPVEQTTSKPHQRIRRLYLVRAFVVLWNTVCETWKWVVRRGIIRTRSHGIMIEMGMDGDAGDATSADEKESEEELEPLVTQVIPPPASDSMHRPSSISLHESPPTSLSKLSPSVSSSSQIPAPEYLGVKVPFSSTRIKSSNLLPNPFSTSLLTQKSSSLTPTRTPSPTPLSSSSPHAPPNARKTPFHLPKILVLDLDETLIHSTLRPMQGHRTGGTGLLGLGGRRNKGAGHMVEIVSGHQSTLYHVYKRPFVDYFLRKVDQKSQLPLIYNT